MNQEHLMDSGDEPREGECMHIVNSAYLATKLLTLQTASKVLKGIYYVNTVFCKNKIK